MPNWPSLSNALPVLRSFFSAGDQPVAESRDIRHSQTAPGSVNDVDSWIQYLFNSSPIQSSRLGTDVVRWRGDWQAQSYAAGSMVSHDRALWVWDNSATQHASATDIPGQAARWQRLAHDAWKGAWSATTDYTPGDIVTNHGSVYMAIQAQDGSVTGNQGPHYDVVKWRSMTAWSGGWSQTTGYPKGAVVTHLQALWYCVLEVRPNSNGTEPAIGSNHWWLIGSVRGERYKGPWLTRTIYVPGDIVYHDGGIFFCTADDSIASDFPPPRDTANWEAVTDFWGAWNSTRYYAGGAIVTHGGNLWAAPANIAPGDTGATPAEGGRWNRIDTSDARIDSRIVTWARAGNTDKIDRTKLGTGTPTSDLFLRGDGAWADPHTEEQQHASDAEIDGRIATWARAHSPTGEAPYSRLPISVADVDRIPDADPPNDRVWKTDGSGNPGWREDADGLDTAAVDARIQAEVPIDRIPSDSPGSHRVWKSDTNGNPGWREDAEGLSQAQVDARIDARVPLDRIPEANPAGDRVWKTNSSGVPGWRDDARGVDSGGLDQAAVDARITTLVPGWSRADSLAEGEVPAAIARDSELPSASLLGRIPAANPSAGQVWKAGTDGTPGWREDDTGGTGLPAGGSAHQVLRRNAEDSPEWGPVGEDNLENDSIVIRKLHPALRSIITAAEITSQDIPVPSAGDARKLLQVLAGEEGYHLIHPDTTWTPPQAWQAPTRYYEGDRVSHRGRVYQALAGSSINVEPGVVSNWQSHWAVVFDPASHVSVWAHTDTPGQLIPRDKLTATWLTTTPDASGGDYRKAWRKGGVTDSAAGWYDTGVREWGVSTYAAATAGTWRPGSEGLAFPPSDGEIAFVIGGAGQRVDGAELIWQRYRFRLNDGPISVPSASDGASRPTAAAMGRYAFQASAWPTSALAPTRRTVLLARESAPLTWHSSRILWCSTDGSTDEGLTLRVFHRGE